MTIFNFYFDWLHISLGIGIVLLILFFKIISKMAIADLDELKRLQADDQFEMLHAYANDTANELILRNEQEFVKNFAELCDEWKVIETKPLHDKVKMVMFRPFFL